MLPIAPPAIAAAETPMVRVPGGQLSGKVIKPFYMDKTHVTVGQFRAFVRASGYVTEMERLGAADVRSLETWGDATVKGACWHHPEGPERPAAPSDVPVVMVTYADALAYAEWSGKRLPTAAEYEWAMRGGLIGKTFAWGDEELPGGRPMANYWHGPTLQAALKGRPLPENLIDPYLRLAPVGKFRPERLRASGHGGQRLGDHEHAGREGRCRDDGRLVALLDGGNLYRVLPGLRLRDASIAEDRRREVLRGRRRQHRIPLRPGHPHG